MIASSVAGILSIVHRSAKQIIQGGKCWDATQKDGQMM